MYLHNFLYAYVKLATSSHLQNMLIDQNYFGGGRYCPI